MKIVIDLTSLYDHLTGIERYALEMSGNIMKEYNENDYILLFKNEIHKEFRAGGKYSLRILSAERDNITYKILKGENKFLFNQITILKALKKIKADAYFFPAFPEPILFNDKNVYTTIHDVGCFDCPDAMKFLSRIYFRNSYKHTFKKAKKIFTVSEFSKERIIAIGKVKEDRVIVAYDGVNVDASYDNERIVASRPALEDYGITGKYILSLSTLEPRKNLKLLIDAYSRLAEVNDNIPNLVLAGRMGWMMDDFLKEYPESVKEKVIITGFIKDEDLPVLYGNAEFFVFPSKYEGFGIPPVEAMAYGTPVLSSDAASMPEVLGDAAEYFESGNKGDLVKQLEYMLVVSEENRKVFVNRGKELALKYAWKMEAKKVVKTIN